MTTVFFCFLEHLFTQPAVSAESMPSRWRSQRMSNERNKKQLLQWVGAVGVVSLLGGLWYFSLSRPKSSKILTKKLVASQNPHLDDGKLLSTKLLTPKGSQIPILGLGTLELGDEKTIFQAISHAINVGYRHIDCASDYLNEHLIGDALSKVFQTNKDM